MKFQGKLSNWNDDKGFGFVEPNGGGDRAFVHIKSFTRRSRRPVDGDVIVYELVKEAGGKFKAVNVSFARDRALKSKPTHKKPIVGTIIIITFCLALAGLVSLDRAPIELLYVYVAMSILTFINYALDKSAAKNNRWRTSENQLHLLSLAGGWPGAFYAQNKLRHKSIKKEFKQVYWITVIMNIAALAWLLTPEGLEFMGTFIS